MLSPRKEYLYQRKLSPLLDSEQIAAAVSRLAAEVMRDYQGKRPLLIGVLKGSFMFMADLIRRIALPVEVEFVTLSSYGSGTLTSGKVQVVRCLRAPVKDRDVIVVEDIVDTGVTLDYFLR
ncbi:MAG: phosphoribosyltransferase family protein, partial [Chloroflexota bacterium]